MYSSSFRIFVKSNDFTTPQTVNIPYVTSNYTVSSIKQYSETTLTHKYYVHEEISDIKFGESLLQFRPESLVCYSKTKELKYTDLKFCLLFYIGVKPGL
jgi:hypothetical protein